MSNVDEILEQCLTDILSGASTLEECLACHPEHTAQLEPLLRTAACVQMGSSVRPSPAFRARTRAKLTMHMQANPRRVARRVSTFWRTLAGATAIVLTLFVTGTVYAQGALPGDPFYEWKLTTEDAWRLVSSDLVETDLRIANRRIGEMNVTVNDQAKWGRALEGYIEVRSRLEDEIDAETLEDILPPAEVFSYPDPAMLTPVPVSEPPQAGATERPTKDKDKEQDKDKDKEKENKNNENRDKDPQEVLPQPQKEPDKIPTIEVPPPIK
jgi:hypothetical protein